MTDEQIIKALECCSNDDCDNCPNTFGNCYANLAGYALDLIKKQQEEIDLLKMDNERMTTKVFEMAMKKVLKEKVRSEAIEEFANRLKAGYNDFDEQHEVTDVHRRLYLSFTDRKSYFQSIQDNKKYCIRQIQRM